ncbi:MAG: nucleoside triphosphate pyrophosphohydrolase [Halomonas sp.]|jgi:ATP diphosphatase|uniref:Nucleoside triphosphate pyrophosphohydrolase n=2 Tax=Vreelandella aquamarina TaxID=77097 RepID=A0A0D7V0J7_9GAMM|nr:MULTISPECIES: nucleoside triphosphate pyrophosphohydrolase [Halomonas]MED5558639.1 nucleoside triphosphate pyrophosphohydrolase [Pseudomonadota bacterium]KJD20429.1 nucleoside triphosphate hydrolase [Halomonas meridiana]MCP1303931.1 nucleoside triphosphate pyrophosphohydrolase [Halomonas sp. R1t8]MCP1328851.1 nucleoside triphosphate pyrophosphohydrolase [Halomonas sp. R1t4]NQY76104.1 nucleoside triphosphate pyrophosphohydrolase [Halomonas sp.]|tara:strand:+ start:351 stop:1178 length:828 start_codon:yes stop_codon:yes gene_type:complete
MRHTLEDLLTLMAVLRDREQGCPWDIQQDWDSIVPHTLEEAYEVADAIERRAFDELPGELGDLLFQVVYYAQFGAEEQRFDFHDIVDTLTAKMLRRHPHVFPDGTLASRRPTGVSADEVKTQQVNSRWEALKADERAKRATQPPSVLDDVPRTLPALSRAAKLSKRAARVGFDWSNAEGVLAKIREELEEVEEALAAGDRQHAQEEVGDLLFAVTNLARTLGADPEQCLRRTNAKFERRFRFVERALAESERPVNEASLDEMESHWQAAKAQEQR